MTLTTNGSRLAEHAGSAFMRRQACGEVNVSARHARPGPLRPHHPRRRTSPHPGGYRRRRRRRAPGSRSTTVALAGLNEDELAALLRWSHERGFDFTLIETMPMGDTGAKTAWRTICLCPRCGRGWPAISTSSPARTAAADRPAISRSASPAGDWASSRPLTHNFCGKLQPRPASPAPGGSYMPGSGRIAPISRAAAAGRRRRNALGRHRRRHRGQAARP